MDTINQGIVKEFLHYDPISGQFTWNNRNRKWFKSARDYKAWNTRYSGKVTGTKRKCNGKMYMTIGIFSKNYYVHRLAFLYMTGVIPIDQVDHIDGNGLNNLWSNLRRVSNQGNAKNMKLPSDNQSGVIGVSWCNTRKQWRSTIVVNRKQIHLIITDNYDEAVAARKAAEIEYGFHCNHGSNRPL